MRRRRYLATTGALLASPLVGQAQGGTGTVASTTQSETFEPLGTVEIDGTMDAVPGPDGTIAYVATTDGFATVDVSDPTDPAVLANPRGLLEDEPNGPLQQIYDVKVDGDRLAVAGPANRGPSLTGFVLYDVSDPANPEQLAFYESGHPIHNFAFEDGVAYLSGNDQASNPLVAVDCSDDDPEEVGRWSLLDHDSAWADVDFFLRYLHDVYVQDGTAYLAHWDAGTWIVDVSDPSSMSTVARVRGRSIETLAEMSRFEAASEYTETPGNDHYVTVDESAAVLAVGSEAWDMGNTNRLGGPGGIELYDISTPSEPSQLATIEAPGTADPTTSGVWTTSHNFALQNDRLYASWYRGGVSVHDVSDPAAPEERVFWEDRDRASFFTAMATDDCVIASSISDRTGADTTEGVFTFPIPTDDTETVVTRPTTTDSPTATDSPATTTTTTDSSHPVTTVTAQPPGDTTTRSGAATTTEATTPSGSGSGPGFGIVSALTGVAAGSWYALRQRGRDDSE
jgi:hypothetical protein